MCTCLHGCTCKIRGQHPHSSGTGPHIETGSLTAPEIHLPLSPQHWDDMHTPLCPDFFCGLWGLNSGRQLVQQAVNYLLGSYNVRHLFLPLSSPSGSHFQKTGTGEMAQRFRVLAAPATDLGLVRAPTWQLKTLGNSSSGQSGFSIIKDRTRKQAARTLCTSVLLTGVASSSLLCVCSKYKQEPSNKCLFHLHLNPGPRTCSTVQSSTSWPRAHSPRLCLPVRVMFSRERH